MKTARKSKIVRSALGIIIAAGLFFSSGLKIPVLDSTTDNYFRKAITKAGVAYATCRVINASVSIVKESSLQLEPAGIGLSLAVGQVLDPIDDMTERLSDVLVTAITSLGVQKLAYEISVTLVPPVLAIFLLALTILVWIPNEGAHSFQKTILRFALLIIVARFCLPLSSLANASLHKHFFAKKISEARSELALGTADLEKFKKLALPEVDGILGTLKNNASFLKRKAGEFKNEFVSIVTNMGRIVENLLKLTFLYVGIFLIQVIILPLIVFWVLVKIANSLFMAHTPILLHHSQPSGSAKDKL